MFSFILKCVDFICFYNNIVVKYKYINIGIYIFMKVLFRVYKSYFVGLLEDFNLGLGWVWEFVYLYSIL